jgi:hypothetical protein
MYWLILNFQAVDSSLTTKEQHQFDCDNETGLNDASLLLPQLLNMQKKGAA